MSESKPSCAKAADGKPDVFDFMGRKVATALVETCEVIDRMKEPFRSGGLTALEEFYFRCTGKHFDWEEFKLANALWKAQREARHAKR